MKTTRLFINRLASLLAITAMAAACSSLPPAAAAVTLTPLPAPTLTPLPVATEEPVPDGFAAYLSQSGDTLPAVAAHFGVAADEIITEGLRDPERILPPGTNMLVPDRLVETSRPDILIYDSDFVYSPSAVGFDIQSFAEAQGGYLVDYSELILRGTTPGSEILAELALGHSINPRLLLTIMEYESGWVTRQPETTEEKRYPMGWIKVDRAGIYSQAGLLIRQLSQGYYGWRAGTLTEIQFLDGSTLRLSPYLNAGTVGVLYALAQYHDRAAWEAALYGPDNLLDVHEALFGNARVRAAGVEPLFGADAAQPELNLPFPPNQKWALTNGPHPAWGLYGPRAALDFAPAGSSGCNVSQRFALAAAAGRVVRDGNGVIVLDLDLDGYEQTGWALLYNHIHNSERAVLGDVLAADDPVGHPSCAGGTATGSHVHFARKFNGEWVLADGGLPLVLSGYRAANGAKDCTGDRFCQGSLDNGTRRAVADAYGNAGTVIMRPESDPKYFYTPTPKP